MCSCRRARDASSTGMVVRTDTERTRHSRRLVLELLGSSVDLSLTAGVARWNESYGADPARFGPPSPPVEDRDSRTTGHHHEPTGEVAETVHQPVKIDNPLYVRDYAKCILCYQCVDACGEQWQQTWAIGVAGRGFDARISTEYAVDLPDSACVYCGNCIQVCPTGALMFTSEHEMRSEDTWDEDRQTRHRHDLPVLRRGVHPDAARAGRPDRQGHVAIRQRRDPREPLRQRPIRLPARPERAEGRQRVPQRGGRVRSVSPGAGFPPSQLTVLDRAPQSSGSSADGRSAGSSTTCGSSSPRPEDTPS